MTERVSAQASLLIGSVLTRSAWPYSAAEVRTAAPAGSAEID